MTANTPKTHKHSTLCSPHTHTQRWIFLHLKDKKMKNYKYVNAHSQHTHTHTFNIAKKNIKATQSPWKPTAQSPAISFPYSCFFTSPPLLSQQQLPIVHISCHFCISSVSLRALPATSCSLCQFFLFFLQPPQTSNGFCCFPNQMPECVYCLNISAEISQI